MSLLSRAPAQLLRAGPVAISAAQILASFTTKVTILAAVSGRIIVPQAHVGVYTGHGVAYDISGAGNLIVGVAADPAFPDISNPGSFGTANALWLDDAFNDVAGYAPLSQWYEQPIVWGFDTANPITGNGTFSWTMFYYLI